MFGDLKEMPYEGSHGFSSAWIAHFMAKGCSERKARSLVLRRSTPRWRKPHALR